MTSGVYKVVAETAAAPLVHYVGAGHRVERVLQDVDVDNEVGLAQQLAATGAEMAQVKGGQPACNGGNVAHCLGLKSAQNDQRRHNEAGTALFSLGRKYTMVMVRASRAAATNRYSMPCVITRLTITTATEPAGPEIMPGLPPNKLVTRQMTNAGPPMPVRGLMWASNAEATTSGTRAVLSPARTSSLTLTV